MIHYSCPKGHAQGVWQDSERAMAVRAGRDPFVRICHCGRTRSIGHFGTNRYGFQLIADIPEHFNDTLGEKVRGRRHLKDLQARKGFQDYDKLTHASSDWHREPARAAERQEKVAALGAKRLEQARRRGEEWAQDSPAVEADH